MLIDQAIIEVRGGDGGDGCSSMRREAYVPRGGPDGGDGGRGGSVILIASPGVDTLLDMAGKHHWIAPNGEPGRGKSQTGHGGENLMVRVPPGTLIFDADTGELIEDLDVADKELLIAKGGTAGRGNEHFKSATNQTPRICTPGEPGERRNLRLELKLIADVGFVGLPNAGKSTLLTRVSAATPKVADYPFTTLEPQLGIADLGEFRRLVLADIPGLIEGAASGAGLGHDFLRHIERTRILVHVIDPEPSDNSDPIANYHTIRKELEGYSPTLGAKIEIIALNKMDLLGGPEDHAAAVELFEKELGLPVMPISAAVGIGTKELLYRCDAIIRELDAPSFKN